MKYLATSVLYFVFFNLISIQNLFAQSKWQKVYSDTNLIDEPASARQTFDGGYFIAGSTNPYATDSGEFFFLKTDVLGNIQWRKTYGGLYMDRCGYAEQTKDSGFILSGSTTEYTGNPKILIIKTDSQGNVVWSKNYFSTGYNIHTSSCIHQTFDGGYLILCQSFISQRYTNLIKIDSIGNISWEKRYTGDGDYFIQTSDSGYIVSGTTQNPQDIFLMKISSIGTAVWGRRLGGLDLEAGTSVLQTQGGYLVTGFTRSFPNGSTDRAYLIKTDYNGLPIWSKTYGQAGVETCIFSICQSSDSNYVLLVSTSLSGGEIYLIKVNSSGDTLWTNSFAPDNIGFSSQPKISRSSDSGFTILAIAFSASGFGPHLIKTDSLGNSACFNTQFQFDVISQPNTSGSISTVGTTTSPTIAIPTLNINVSNGTDWDPCLYAYLKNKDLSTIELAIYPNPASYKINFQTNRPNACYLEIKNFTGVQIFSRDIIDLNSIEVNCENFIPGFYFAKVIFDNGESITSKFVIMR